MIAILLVVFALLAIIMVKSGESSENYTSKKFKFLTKENRHPTKGPHHGVDTGCFPSFPRPLYDSYHSKYMAEKLDKMQQCDNCEVIEKQLVEMATELLQSGFSQPFPDLSKFQPSCETCVLLVQTWERYFSTVKAVVDFLSTNKLPNPPKTDRGCKNCGDMENKVRKYSEKVRKQTETIIKNETVSSVGIPTHKYKEIKSCCEDIYNKWTIYTFKLIAIGHYVNCTRRNEEHSI